MIQIAKGQMKEISEKQMQAIKKIVQSRDFTLSEYRKLKEVLDRRVVTRQDASMFLEYCFAKVRFERYFNGHHHKAYAACCFCKGRDDLRKIENIKTGQRHWCCQTCRSNITDEDVMVLPTARGGIGGTQKRNEVARIRGLATDIALMARDYPMAVVAGELADMAEEIWERASGLLKGKAEAERTETSAAGDVQLREGKVGCVEVVKNEC
jgi:hypothetical protein